MSLPFPTPGNALTDDPLTTLWHYVRGQILDWSDAPGGPLRWTRMTHRGVQWLDKIHFPRHQRRYIFSDEFDVRFDTAFEQTIRGCAAQRRRDPNWITEPYVRALLALHRMGFAHSFETWQDGQLVGGAFGLQLGSIMTCESMFHTVSNASKAAYGQTLIQLKERGFKLLDGNGVANHHVQYGEEWLPQWRFESLLLQCLPDRPALADHIPPPPPLPLALRTLIPLMRLRRALSHRVHRGADHRPRPPIAQNRPRPTS
jgi:leucyl/phenylalanyl-tRNA--protein transferase